MVTDEMTAPGPGVNEKQAQTSYRTALVRAARELVRCSGWPVPIHRGKSPDLPSWSQLRLTEEGCPKAFERAVGVGMILGTDPLPVADVDLDTPEAIALAPSFLPEPLAKFGRPEARAAHWLYRLNRAGVPKDTYSDPTGSTDGDGKPVRLLEFLSTGQQVLIPPSRHDLGQRRWDVGGLAALFAPDAPVTDPETIKRAVRRLAAATALARHWPEKGSGCRHELNLPLVGMLLRGGWTDEEASDFIRAVLTVAGDEEVEDRLRAVGTTRQRMTTGELITGQTRLVELFNDILDNNGGRKLVGKLRDWLEVAPEGGCQGETGTGGGAGRGRPPLWSRWVRALNTANAQLLWTNTGDAYFKLPSGELFGVNSDAAARWFQANTDGNGGRDVGHGSELWKKAAAGLRSWTEQHGDEVTVYHRTHINWDDRTAWIGCADWQTNYRVTADGIERVQNGDDGILIVGGDAPPLEEITPAGELTRWLGEDTWATPRSRVILAIQGLMFALGAGVFPARPIFNHRGPSGSGKTTTVVILASAIHGVDCIAQKIKPDYRENESRIVNELVAVFDNMDNPPKGFDVEDFLATAVTSSTVAVRTMRREAELTKKPIRAHTVITSFLQPDRLKRTDLVKRMVPIEFDKPDDGRTRDEDCRRPDRVKLWRDLLNLLQAALSKWRDVPGDSEHRAVQFVQLAHALLSRDEAAQLERELLAEEGAVAASDNPLLAVLENKPPDKPMTAKDLFAWWWPLENTSILAGLETRDGLPKNTAALGCLLRGKEGRFGRWIIKGTPDRVLNVTLWSFTAAQVGDDVPLREGDFWTAVLAQLNERLVTGDGFPSPGISGSISGA